MVYTEHHKNIVVIQPSSLPNPPLDLYEKPLLLTEFTTGYKWLRIHKAEYAPMHFASSGKNRFDSSGCAVLYVAQNIEGSFVEVFCRDSESDIDEPNLQEHKVAEFKSSKPLKLIDLSGSGLVRMGLDGRISTGDYKVAQKWARAFQDHPNNADGILYPSRFDPTQKLAALFARSGEFLTVKQHGSINAYLGSDLYVILQNYGLALA